MSVGCLTNALGLALCPPQLDPHFRLHDREQPEWDWEQPVRQHQAPSGSITIATIPIASVLLTPDDALPKGFYVRRIQGELWLRGYRAGPAHGGRGIISHPAAYRLTLRKEKRRHDWYWYAYRKTGAKLRNALCKVRSGA